MLQAGGLRKQEIRPGNLLQFFAPGQPEVGSSRQGDSSSVRSEGGKEFNEEADFE